MNAKELVNLKLKANKADRILFCPAIYEHKAKLIGKSPSQVACDTELLEKAVIAEYETYHPDMLTVGIDVYNVEAEALGCGVLFPDNISGTPVIHKRILDSINDVNKLISVDPQRSGRMPVFLEAAKKVHEKLGDEIYIRGAVTGPFSMAAELLGLEPLILAMVKQPDEYVKLLNLCCDVAICYGLAFIERGLQICIFDSQASPPMTSPGYYQRLVVPHVARLIRELKKAGAKFVEYVVGGDTTNICHSMLSVGADIILCDFNADVNTFVKNEQAAKILIRRNIDLRTIENSSKENILEQTSTVIELAKRHSNIIIGTSVISYNTELKHLLEVKKFLENGLRK
ncbi:MAG: uroporphyrinogen decarboxylase family protein [Planctomycetota bacterium]